MRSRRWQRLILCLLAFRELLEVNQGFWGKKTNGSVGFWEGLPPLKGDLL
ncbi:MAG: hypothetical protein CM1200mP4_3510 [Rhodospirillaceae bacterium]|nr:MAG: hypothetical protein CM1200mP4_3510 [Rhodospirillaceae bacterium]